MEPLSLWEQLLKRVVWQQLGELADKKILDFGSGLGVTADHYDNNFNNANAVLDGKDVITSKFGTIHYYEDTDIVQWCGNALNIVKIYGIRTFWDLQQDQAIEQNTGWQEKMIQIEMRVSEMEAFRSIAFFHHVILKK